MRSYDVATASLAISAPRKWTDNLLSHHRVPDVLSAQRGVARRISYAGLIRLSVVRTLHVMLGVGVRDALLVAEGLLDPQKAGVVELGHLRLSVDLGAIGRQVDERLADAMESAPRPRRGRPPAAGRV